MENEWKESVGGVAQPEENGAHENAPQVTRRRRRTKAEMEMARNGEEKKVFSNQIPVTTPMEKLIADAREAQSGELVNIDMPGFIRVTAKINSGSGKYTAGRTYTIHESKFNERLFKKA